MLCLVLKEANMVSFSGFWRPMKKAVTSLRAPVLLTPGPVMIPPLVRKALSRPAPHHRSSQFKSILKQVSDDLKEIFQTKNPVLILHSSGTGAMSAVVAGSLSPGDEVLCLCAGKFGERWRDIAQSYKMKTHCLYARPGEAVSPSAVKSALKSYPLCRAVFTSACETSTAVEHDIEGISKVLKATHSKALLVVDGITGVGAMPLPMDKWGIDVLVAGSQKSFMLPAGLAFVALSERAWRACDVSSCPKYYFDLKKEKEAQAKGQTAFSASVPLIRALSQSLDLIKKKGLGVSVAHCSALRSATQAFCQHLELDVLSSAHAVTAIKVPEGLSGSEIQKQLEVRYNIVIAGGQGELKGKIWRIGHLGPVSFRDHLHCLKALAKELNRSLPEQFSGPKLKEALRKAKKALTI